MDLKLKDIRKRMNMTQQELAAAVGATKRQIGAWERGENDLPMDYAATIADVLNCSIDEIAGRDSTSVLSLIWEERKLIRLYRNMDDETKHLLFEQAKIYALACDVKNESLVGNEVMA